MTCTPTPTTTRLAAAAFARAQDALRQAGYWQAQADAEWAAAADARKALTWELWKSPGDLKAAVAETAKALWDEGKAGYYLTQYLAFEGAAELLSMAAETAHLTATLASAAAKGADVIAATAARWAAEARVKARDLAAYAAGQEALARQYAAQATTLAAAYARQQARKAAALARKLAKKVIKAAKAAGHAVAHAATAAARTVARTVAKAATATAHYVAKHSQVITQAGLAAAGAALTVVNAVQLGLDPATDATEAADLTALGTDLTEEGPAAAEETAPEAAPAEGEPGPSCGGASFTPATKVLLANGTAAPLSQLRPGQKVLATNTRTGKTQPQTITAVLAHHDTGLYDLTITANGRTSAIGTTSNHLFWDPYLDHGWTPANHLKPGAHLKTPDGQSAIVVGGSIPAVHDGWMWDLTVPGNNDHDFYVAVAATAVLVHNCGDGTPGYSTRTERAGDLPGRYTQGQSTRDPASQWYHEMLSNDDLLGSINNADEGEGIVVSQEGRIIGGNHRMDELLTRVGDGRIGPETPIMIQVLGDG